MQLPEYESFTKAVAKSDDQPNAAFDALCALTRDIVGVKLFTVMSRDLERGESQRIYSNMPEAYPVSGKKPANETHWSRLVLDQKQTFVANDIESIAEV